MKLQTTIVTAVISMALLFTGCSDIKFYSEHLEPEELVLIQTIGIDKKDGKVTVTASTGTGLDNQPPKVFESTDVTLSEAINNIRNSYLKDEAYFSHTSHILIGEEAARDGIEEYLDYTARNINMRLSTDIYVVKGATAAEIIKNGDGGDISAMDMLESIEEKAQYMLSGKVSTCEDAIESMMADGTALITAIEKTAPMEATDEEATEITANGYGLIKDCALDRYIDKDTATGTAFILGEIKSGEFTAELENGVPVTLKISDVNKKITARYSGENITGVDIELELKVNVEGVGGSAELTDESTRREIEKRAGENIKKMVDSAIESAQKAETDFCGIGDNLYLKSPYKFGSAHRQWEMLFPSTEINSTVNVRLERTYDIENTLDLQGDKNE